MRWAMFHGHAQESVLDAYAQQRRDVFVNVTSPAASENKRRLTESDPNRRAADIARLRQLYESPAMQREALLLATGRVTLPAGVEMPQKTSVYHRPAWRPPSTLIVWPVTNAASSR